MSPAQELTEQSRVCAIWVGCGGAYDNCDLIISMVLKVYLSSVNSISPSKANKNCRNFAGLGFHIRIGRNTKWWGGKQTFLAKQFSSVKLHTQGPIMAPIWFLGMQNIHWHTYPNTSKHLHTSVHQDLLLTLGSLHSSLILPLESDVTFPFHICISKHHQWHMPKHFQSVQTNPSRKHITSSQFSRWGN